MKRFNVIMMFVFLLFALFSHVSHAEAPSINTYHEGTGAYDTQGSMNNPSLSRESQNNIGVFWADGIFPTESLGLSASSLRNLAQDSRYKASLVGRVSGMITDIYTTPPANTNMYIADVSSRFGLAQPVYAQGVGFQGLSPLLPIWRAFRNVAYGFLIAVMVIIGFMVMFRMKIDPRTVISVQAALPRIITTIILITFSYAIVGILIDIMYIMMFLIITVLNAAVPFASFSDTVSNYTGGSISAIFGAMHAAGTGGVISIVNLLGGTTLQTITGIIGAVVGATLGFGAGGPIGALIGGVAGGTGGAFTPHVLVYIIVLVAILFAFLRIFFLLLNAYIQIILSLVLGPLQIMLGAIPNNGSFGAWLRNLIANLMVFPVVSGMLLIGQLLSAAALRDDTMWAPPGLGGGSEASAVAGIIGLGMALMIPNVANSIKEALKAKPAVQAGLSPIVAPLGTITGTGMQLLSASYYLQSPGARSFLSKVTGERIKPPGEPSH